MPQLVIDVFTHTLCFPHCAEDYCLNLFNNVLTSANTAERYTLSRTNSKASMHESSSATRLSDDADEEPCCAEPLGPYTTDSMQDSLAGTAEPQSDSTLEEKQPLLCGMGSSDATAAAASTSSSSGGGGDITCSSGLPPRHRAQSGAQQPLVSALAGTRRKHRKQQLSFALPGDKTPAPNAIIAAAAAATSAPVAPPSPAAAEGKAAADTRRQPVAPAACSNGLPPLYVDTGSWNELRSALPASPSCASLSSLSSLNSTRSWTLMAYLPDVLIRTFSNGSSGSSSDGDASNSSSRASSDGGCPDATADAIAAMFAGPEVVPAAPPAAAAAEAAAAAVDAAADVTSVGQVELTAPAAAVIAGRRHSSSNGFGMRHAKSAVDLSVCSLSDSSTSSSSSSSCGGGSSSLDGSSLFGPRPLTAAAAAAAAGATEQMSLQLQQGSAAARARGLRRSVTSASLTTLTQSSGRLLAPLKLTSSLAMVGSLLPSLRAVVHASRAVRNTVSSIKEAAFNVPLSVFEAGLIKALKPPMYKPVGQQWILSATGLVPQQQPIYMYPKHVSDVYWHKELALVAFREHSIVFYKTRLLQQARRR